jgi:hypothetical protein
VAAVQRTRPLIRSLEPMAAHNNHHMSVINSAPRQPMNGEPP